MWQHQKKSERKNGHVSAKQIFVKLLVLMRENFYLKPKAAKKAKLKMISVYAEIMLQVDHKIRKK